MSARVRGPKCVESNTLYTTVPPAYYTGRVLGPNRMSCDVRCPDCGRMLASYGPIHGPKYCVVRVPRHNRPA